MFLYFITRNEILFEALYYSVKKIFFKKKYLRQFQKWKKHEFLQSGKNQDREI